MDLDLKLNGPEITRALEEAFSETNDLFNRNAAREITKDKWAWPNAPSPRDIVDLGGLRDSYQRTNVSAREVDHTWTVDYAMAVHEGAVISGSGGFPGRPWTLEPIERLPKDFEKVAKRLLAAVQ